MPADSACTDTRPLSAANKGRERDTQNRDSENEREMKGDIEREGEREKQIRETERREMI